MDNWLKYMKQAELQDLQFKLSQRPWTPPTEDQVDRMLKEIRAAQTERSKAPDVMEIIHQGEALKDKKIAEAKFEEAGLIRDLLQALKSAMRRESSSTKASAPAAP